MIALQQILEHKIVAILRGVLPNDALKIAQALHKGGVRLLEITLNSPGALASIEQVSAEMKDKMLVGAGTVLDATSAKSAMAAGACFIISPVLNKQVIRAARRHGAVSIPGAYTPTEVLDAYVQGGDIIKVFPAPGPQYIKDLLAPLPHLPLMPTGGIALQNIKDFKATGAVAFGVGSALVDAKASVNEGYLKSLSAKAKQLVEAVA